MAFKMKAGKKGPMKKNFGNMVSPMDKALVGNQKNLPEQLKKKIEAAPESPNKKDYKSEKEARRDSYGIRPSKGDKDLGDTARRIERARKDKNYSTKLESKKPGKIDVTTERSTAVGGRYNMGSTNPEPPTRQERKEKRKMAKRNKKILRTTKVKS
tara:strand:- start:2104 stop:2571 length:468 start_codon:yes stop_codon:yes gene_type:complete